MPVRDIEINDLLGRDPVTLDTENIGKLLEGRRVMVTGAGGSIGSEICRQIMAFRPRVPDSRRPRREPHLRHRAGTSRPPHAPRQCTPASATSPIASGWSRSSSNYRPEVVFHAAAHKHVPLMEANVGEAIRNNVFGTKCVADLADQLRRGELRPDLDRQGRAPHQRHGRHQANRRALRPYPLAGVGHAIHRRPLRQRAGLRRQRRADLPGANPPAAARSPSPIRA